jgi:hypothetical protein
MQYTSIWSDGRGCLHGDAVSSLDGDGLPVLLQAVSNFGSDTTPEPAYQISYQRLEGNCLVLENLGIKYASLDPRALASEL